MVNAFLKFNVSVTEVEFEKLLLHFERLFFNGQAKIIHLISQY